MSKITDAVSAAAIPIAEKYGCEIWNVEYVKEAAGWFLRLFIDRVSGVSINDCEAVSRDLDPVLDELEHLFHDGYIFEVSSAGAERYLRGPSDFPRFAGHLAEVKLYRAKFGKKSFIGHLAAYSDSCVELEISGDIIRFEKSEIAGVRLRIS